MSPLKFVKNGGAGVGVVRRAHVPRRLDDGEREMNRPGERAGGASGACDARVPLAGAGVAQMEERAGSARRI
ncbi:putative translation elongation factor G [Burkholderia pseudomallei MSHR5596]|nr:translation elongation factor G [Burkholderia pseudomallei]KGR97957.1 putative translation elongation factor G [Burkholderia pseudomallei MSHR7504]KGS22121.1 putative translation elongation factor G [Burkholderia pseudomallei MSHR5569]KGS76736.1 putative translation elongation factor G [Burkholderia pseudomallei MSHR5596]